MHWTIRGRVLALMGIFVALLVTNFVVLQVWIRGSASTARELNLAGRQRMLTQQMTKDALLIRAGVCTRAELASSRAAFEATLRGLFEGDAELGLTRVEDPRIREKLQDIESLWKAFVRRAEHACEAEHIETDDLARLQASSFELVTKMNAAVGLMEADANAAMTRLGTTSLILLLLSLGAALVAYLVIRRAVLARLIRVTRTMDEIASTRDLTLRLPEKPADELGQAATAFNLMMTAFQDNTREVQQTAKDLENHAVRAAASARDTRRRTSDQFKALESVSAAMQEMAASVQGVARGTVDAAAEADSVETEAADGGQRVGAAVADMQALVREVEAAAATMDRLDAQANAIGGIVETIGRIADQTKLLAVNAAIEAEHAGDRGMGFKVVSREIERLARHTETSTRDIEEVIARLRERIATSALEIREGGRRARDTATRSAETTSALDKIASAAASLRGTNHGIAAAAKQQSVVARDVSENLLSLKRLAEDTADSGRQAVESGERLGAVADRLRGLTRGLKT